MGKSFRDDEEHTGSFGGNTFENIVDKAVKDSHRLIGDTSIGVHLLEHCGT